MVQENPPLCEVIVLTNLPVEYQAVRRYLQDTRETVHPSGTVYEWGTFPGEQCSWSVAMAEISNGGVAAAQEAEKALTFFSARLAIFVGIADGIKDVKLGDVVAATKVYAYEAGRAAERFEPHPELGYSSYALEQRALAEARKSEWLARLPGTRLDPVPRVLSGAIASGDKELISTRSSLARLLRTNYSDTLAIEMAGHGFLHAIRVSQGVQGLIVRGISNVIGEDSPADPAGARQMAAEHAAAFAFQVLAMFSLPESTPVRYTSLATSREEQRTSWQIIRFRKALQRYEKEHGPEFSLATLDARIQLEYIDMSAPWEKASSIIEVYRKSDDILLLLGKIGSGKSTSMKELTLALVQREIGRKGEGEPVSFPVFLSLSDWCAKKKPIKTWLVEYLTSREHARLGLDQQLIRYWAREGRFILLMDGLDEMSEEDSRKCFAAMQKWRQETNLSRIVISCQLERYKALEEDKLFFEESITRVVIQELNASQGQNYLAQKNEAELSHFVYQDEEGQHLKELMDTPLFLNFLVEAVAGKDVRQQISEIDTEEDIWKKYVNRYMDNNKLYGGQNALYWLKKLASRMPDKSEFFFQPDYLPEKTAARGLYNGSTWLIMVLFALAACVLIVRGGFPLWQLLLLLGLIAGFYGYLWKSFLTGFYMLLLYTFTLCFPYFSLESTEGQTWLQQITEWLISLVVLFSPLVLLVGLAFLLEWITAIPLGSVIIAAWLLGGLFWYIFFQLRDFPFFQLLTARLKVMEIWLKLRDLMVFRQIDDPLPFEKLSPKLSNGLLIGLLIGIVSSLVIWLCGHTIWRTDLLAVALLVGLSIWLDGGLGATIRSYLLRLWFWRAGVLPLEAGFLDDVSKGKLLIRRGNGYRFPHGALKAYLAKKKSV